MNKDKEVFIAYKSVFSEWPIVVNRLRGKTYMAGLTLVAEDPGSHAEFQLTHKHLCL